jgi:hypothetical protein
MRKAVEILAEVGDEAVEVKMTVPVDKKLLAEKKVLIEELELPEIREQANAMSCD